MPQNRPTKNVLVRELPNDVKLIYSYETLVGVIVPAENTAYVTDRHYSQTTTKHCSKYVQCLGCFRKTITHDKLCQIACKYSESTGELQ